MIQINRERVKLKQHFPTYELRAIQELKVLGTHMTIGWLFSREKWNKKNKGGSRLRREQN